MSGNPDSVEHLVRQATSDLGGKVKGLFGPKTRRIDLEKPRWDQRTYWGRAKHFFTITNPMNLLCSSSELENAKDIVTKYRKGDDLPELSDDEIWKAKHIYDSAFHPDTGEKVVIIGRMSAQVPVNVLITTFMMSFYKSRAQVIFWQWVNQSYNAVTNYSNRSGTTEIPPGQMLAAYVGATTGGIGASLGLNHLFRNAHPLLGRWVPFISVAAANAVNIPIVRFKEIENGVPVSTEDGKDVGVSSTAARWGIFQVVVSRIAMAIPTMIGIPVIINSMERRGILKKYPSIVVPTNAFLCGILLTFATPLACAIFQQQAKIAVSSLEPPIQEKVKKMSSPPQYLYYNKGL